MIASSFHGVSATDLPTFTATIGMLRHRGAGRLRDPGAAGDPGQSDHGAPSRVRRGQKSGSVARPNLVGDPVLPESERTLSPAAPGRLHDPQESGSQITDS